jgi:hypothetical protein
MAIRILVDRALGGFELLFFSESLSRFNHALPSSPSPHGGTDARRVFSGAWSTAGPQEPP